MTANAAKLAAIGLVMMTVAACDRQPPGAGGGKGNNAVEELNIEDNTTGDLNNMDTAVDPGNNVVENGPAPANTTPDNGTAPPAQ